MTTIVSTSGLRAITIPKSIVFWSSIFLILLIVGRLISFNRLFIFFVAAPTLRQSGQVSLSPAFLPFQKNLSLGICRPVLCFSI